VPVEVRLPTVLRQHAGGQPSVQANGGTVGEVLEDLVRQFPAMRGQVITQDGTLHKFVNVYLNDDDVRYLDLYSCFASSLHFACDALGLSPTDSRGLTVTGGLPYHGGPASGYVTHSIAGIVESIAKT